MEQNFSSFWLCWALTVGLVAYQITRASLNPKEALGFPTVVGLMWLYFYGALPYQLVKHTPGALSPDILALEELQAFLAYASLLAGWHIYLATSARAVRQKTDSSIDLDRLWWWGIGLQLIGLASYYSFGASGRTFQETSAYWYMAFHLCYPGMSICVAVLALSPRHRGPSNFALLVPLAMGIIWPFLFGARRGPTFVAIIALSFSFLIVRRRLPRPVQVLGVFVVAGFLLMALLTSRSILYDDAGNWKQVFKELTFQQVIEDRTTKTGDNEFYNGYLLL